MSTLGAVVTTPDSLSAKYSKNSMVNAMVGTTQKHKLNK